VKYLILLALLVTRYVSFAGDLAVAATGAVILFIGCRLAVTELTLQIRPDPIIVLAGVLVAGAGVGVIYMVGCCIWDGSQELWGEIWKAQEGAGRGLTAGLAEKPASVAPTEQGQSAKAA
jgi:hypothetical protein